MDSLRPAPTMSDIDTTDDLSALAWVHDELRCSLDAAHKALRRFVKEAEAMAGSDVDAVDPVVLRTARQQIHQGVGALELVGLPAAATFLRASEAAVQRGVAKPDKLNTSMVDDIERASFALLDYLARMLAGKPVSALSLFPQYRAVQEAAAASRIHPADLWTFDWQWHALPSDANAVPLAPDAATHAAFEQQLLALMRGASAPATRRLSDICAGLGAGSASLQAATLWKLAAAVFEAQTDGLLKPDVFTKRVASRLLAQLRVVERADGDVSERLAQDLLFFCAQTHPSGDGRLAGRLASVRHAYGLAQHAPTDYSTSSLGRFDPAWVSQARKRVAAAKESWSAVAAGEMHRLSGLAEQSALVNESLKRLFVSGASLAHELQHAIAQTQQSGIAPPAPLAMEVATALLYIDAALEDAAFDAPGEAGRVQRLAERIASVGQGAPAQPLEAWMEELYRRVSDRQTMGSVVQELRVSLSEAERLIDQFFRNPADRDVLMSVPPQLSAMRGVLSVLGMEHACTTLLRMRDDVDGLMSTEVDPARVTQAVVFDRLAGNLGALGFLIDMLGVQPQLAKSMFAFDATSGTLSPVMGFSDQHKRPLAAAVLPVPPPVEPRLLEQAQMLAFTAVRGDVSLEDVSRDLEHLSQQAGVADQPALAATVLEARNAIESATGAADLAVAREKLSEALVDFVATASGPAGLESEATALRAVPHGVGGPVPIDLAEDDEMREIFLEEAREVLHDAEAACAELSHLPGDLSALTTLRRAFHTLKGSSRMVGLKDFGEAAWSCEQLFNTCLAEQQPADESLLEFTGWSLGSLSQWVDDIAHRREARCSAAEVAAAAQSLKRAPPPHVPALSDAQAVSAFAALSLQDPLSPLFAEPAVAEPSPAFELDLSLLDESIEALPTGLALPLDLDAAAAESVFQATDLGTDAQLAWPEEADLPVDVVDMDLDLDFDLDLDLDTDAGRPAAEPVLELQEATAPSYDEEEQVKLVGPIRIGIPLFNIYLNEADELSRRLSTEMAEWAMELHRPISETSIALAHSLAGSSATVGFADLSHLARALEHAQMRSQAIGHGTDDEGRLFVDAAEEIRRLLHQFAAGFLKEPQPALLQRLVDHEISSARRLEASTAAHDRVRDSTGSGSLDGGVFTPVALPDPVPAHAAPLALAEVLPAAEIETGPATIEPVEPALVEPAAQTAHGGFGDPESRFDLLGVAELKPFVTLPASPVAALPVRRDVPDVDDELDSVDALDAELFHIFVEEGEELLPQLSAKLRAWARHPNDRSHATASMRTLHTLKGGARLAGAMRLGEMAHRLENRIEQLLVHDNPNPAEVEALQTHSDALLHEFEALRRPDLAAETAIDQAAGHVPTAEPVAAQPIEPLLAEPQLAAELEAEVEFHPESQPARLAEVSVQAVGDAPEIDWSRFLGRSHAPRQPADRSTAPSTASVRVRAPLLDRLVNQAGEVSITRARIEIEVVTLKGSLVDLTDNLERLRAQLREIELHGETQMSSRLEAAKAAAQSFDPLEFDRFTRFQELTRMMAESVNDVATVQRTLQRTLEKTEDELAAQARLTRDLQGDLLRTRMVEFEGLSDRLYRVVRQAAKETGKQVRLDIVGGSIEVDRGVLDRMTASFEHLLRNSVTHGIEAPEARIAAGKDASGSIVVALSHEGNEVGVEFRDDGAGLNLQRIRDKAVACALLDGNLPHTDAELANLIFTAGFSTADKVTELAGRGVGMDVVRSEVNAMGGRIETSTAAGLGTGFKLVLPLTTAVTQVVMLRSGEVTVAVPSTLVEVVRRAKDEEIAQACESGTYAVAERNLPFFWLGALLQLSPRSAEAVARTRPVVVIRSAQQRIVLHVDEVIGNQEVVVKNLGPQLSKVPGLAGMTLRPSGAVALIYNPVALATLYGEAARAATQAAVRAPQSAQLSAASAVVRAAPLILVVDDSLTVRRVTQRLLLREGYRVVLAKDGLDALERLSEERPQMVLSDIEMPRMDGFDLVRNIRGDARLRDLPVIMITSRIAQKHRDYAAELGVDHYLGKPYDEEALLALVGRYTAHDAVV